MSSLMHYKTRTILRSSVDILCYLNPKPDLLNVNVKSEFIQRIFEEKTSNAVDALVLREQKCLQQLSERWLLDSPRVR